MSNNIRITHICLNAYIDGWGYQENLLPLYQKKDGMDVSIIASFNHFPPYMKSDAIKDIQSKGRDYNENGIHSYKIKTIGGTTSFTLINKRLYRTINQSEPDIIFHHDVTIPSLFKVVLYKIFHPKVKIIVDNHADYINESQNKLWVFLYTKCFTRFFNKVLSPFIDLYYGVTPVRCDYLIKCLGAPQSKVLLLPIGCDTDMVDEITDTKEELKIKYGFKKDSFVVVSGGKMGADKGTHDLIKAVETLDNNGACIKLLLFGKFSDEDTEKLASQKDFVNIQGWCDRRKTLELLIMADVACWPIHHTTLIEDAVACGTPLIVRKTGNTSHIIDGNGVYIENGKQSELEDALKQVLEQTNYKDMLVASDLMRRKLSYSSLSKKILTDLNIV